MHEILSFELLFGITVLDVATLTGSALAGLLLAWLVSHSLAVAARRKGPKSLRAAVVGSLDGPLRWSLITAGLWVGYVATAGEFARWTATDREYSVFFASELPWLIWFGFRLTNDLTKLWAERAAQTTDKFDDQLVPIVRTLAKLSVFVFGILMIVQNLGGEVGSLLAGLGLGGAAIALASKDMLANVFGSLVIFVDRPFQVGDRVAIGSHQGVVEEVGLRVTRLRTPSQSVITLPNSLLTTTAIDNLSLARERKLALTLRLAQATEPAKVQAAIADLRVLMVDDARLVGDSVTVHLVELGASLDVEASATLAAAHDDAATVRETLLLSSLERLRALGIALA
jgi:MscS family membrane protein